MTTDADAILRAHDDDIETGCATGYTPEFRRACAAERERRRRDAAEYAGDFGPGEALRHLREVATMERPPIYTEEALRRRAADLGVEAPADFGTALELVPRPMRPSVVWARRVGDVTFAAHPSDTKPRPFGVQPDEVLWLTAYGRLRSQDLGSFFAKDGWDLADELLWLRGEEASTIAEARASVAAALTEAGAEYRWRSALQPRSSETPYAQAPVVREAARLRGAVIALPRWLRGAPYRALGFASAAAARAAGWGSGYDLFRAETSLGQVPVVVMQPGLGTVLTRDGLWVSYRLDPSAYPEAVREAHPRERERVAAELARR